MRSHLVVLLLGIVLSGAASSQQRTLPTEVAVRTFADELMAGVSAEQIALDSERLIPYWARLRPEFVREKVEAIRYEQALRRNLFGKSIGFEFIGQSSLGTSLLRLSYIQRLERTPLLWRIYFYKANDSWSLQGVLLDEDPSVGFREFAK